MEEMKRIKNQFAEKALPMAAEVKSLIKEYGDMKVGEVNIMQMYSGMRGVKSLVTETSNLDPEEGIRFRGYTIPELRELLPKAEGGVEPLPEGIFYLMLNDQIPTREDVNAISNCWARRSNVPIHVFKAIDALPHSTHPMTQFSIGITALQTESLFAKAYKNGVSKKEYWDATYEDSMNLIAKLPRLAAYIYRRKYRNGEHIEPNPNLDWAANFAHMLGFDSDEMKSLMRLYMTIHVDHEGGNVSAHTTHLVGSALSDPYISFAAGMNGLAGPLHGLANQEVIKWILAMKEELAGGGAINKAQVEQYVRKTLSEGKVIPGFGHAVLRKTDPRYTAQQIFAEKHCADSELVNIVWMLLEVVPPILNETGKVKNPWPNVDAHSGALLMSFGLIEHEFYTVLFGVSRALGVLASLCWDRALNLPIERPKSVTTKWVKEFVAENAVKAEAKV